MAQSAASVAGKKEGETRDLPPFKERGRETVNVWTTVVIVVVVVDGSARGSSNVESDTFQVSLFNNESSFVISVM